MGFYDNTPAMADAAPAAAPAAAPVPEAGTDATFSARLYGATNDPETGVTLDPLEAAGMGTPDAIRKARAERGQGMFSDGDNAETRLAITKAMDAAEPNAPATLKQAMAAEYVAIGGDMGLNAAEVTEIAKVAHAVYSDIDAVTPDRSAAWAAQSAKVAAGYGSRSAAVVAEARRMVAADPRAHGMLARGLGDHPAVVKLALAAADRRLRDQSQGKLR
jgi:hypothetical protein